MSSDQDYYNIKPMIQHARLLSIIFCLLLVIVYIVINAVQLGSPQEILSNSGTVWKIVLLAMGLCVGITILYIDESYFSNRYDQFIPNTLSQSDTFNTSPQTSNAGDVPQRNDLITRSLIFILLYIPLTIFMYTSSGSALGIGLMNGLGIGLGLELWLLQSHPTVFRYRFLQQLSRSVSASEIRQSVILFISFVGLFVLLTLFQL